jgi:hypothetical protein
MCSNCRVESTPLAHGVCGEGAGKGGVEESEEASDRSRVKSSSQVECFASISFSPLVGCWV